MNRSAVLPNAGQGSEPAAATAGGRVPRLSIGLPVYNAAQFLDESIASILAQTFTDFELIVCDNASTDATAQIVQRWAARDPRISVHRAERNLGAAPNFNWSFRLARGELFKWCAGDDALHRDYLARCIAALDAEPEAVLAYPGTVDIDEHGKVIGELHDEGIEANGDVERPELRFREMILIMHSCVSVFGVIRAEALRRSSLIGSFVGSDQVLLAQLALKGKFRLVRENLFLHREHRGRSIRGDLADIRKRAAWFNTKARGPSFPFWRFLLEYSRAAMFNNGLPLRDRLRCCLEVARWVKWGYSRELLKDLLYHLSPRVKAR